MTARASLTATWEGFDGMKKVTVRMDDGMLTAIKERVGERGMNRLVVGLIDGWLTAQEPKEVVSGDLAIVDPTTLEAVEVKRVIQRPAPALFKGRELSPSEVPEGAVCGFQTRAGICGQPAKFARGTRYFCAAH